MYECKKHLFLIVRNNKHTYSFETNKKTIYNIFWFRLVLAISFGNCSKLRPVQLFKSVTLVYIVGIIVSQSENY